jgi:hypothetical protein
MVSTSYPLRAGHTIAHPCFASLSLPEHAVIVEVRAGIAELTNGLCLPQTELTFIETGERWAPIADYDHYLLSSHGKVVSLHYFRTNRQRLLKVLNLPFHPRVSLSNRAGTRQIGLNRLVAQAFLPPSAEKRLTHVIPKDGNLLNVQVDNLQWADPREKHDEAVMKYLYRRGEQHHLCKLTTAEVVAVRLLVAQGSTRQTVADTYGVSQQAISLIANGLSRCTS